MQLIFSLSSWAKLFITPTYTKLLRMKLYGLIGYPLGHSFSKGFFTEKFAQEGIKDAAYELFPIDDIAKIKDVLAQNPTLRGLNVTIPYKESVIPFLDKLDESAEICGAVNVIKIKNGKLIGYNSDTFGFENSMTNWFKEMGHSFPNFAFVLGTGGAAKAVYHSLKKMKFEVYFVSRNTELRCFSYDDFNFYLKTNKSSIVVVNATPLGTFPNIDAAPPMDYSRLKNKEFLFDLVYNPEQTAFMKKGLEKGCQVKNGLEMLHLQAEKAWSIWQK